MLFTQTVSLELTHENYDQITEGKTVFIKHYAPWCGHCKAMARDWKKLMDEYADSATVVVAEADCTGTGKKLCEKHGIKGFPAIRFGDPSNLEEYKSVHLDHNGSEKNLYIKSVYEQSLTKKCLYFVKKLYLVNAIDHVSNLKFES